MTFKEKIRGILDGSYNLTPAEVNLENRLWERQYSDEYMISDEEKAERLKSLKEYNREYHREYYRRKLAKGKWTADRAYTTKTADSVSRTRNKQRQATYRNKKCIYLGETLNFGTLVHRLFKEYGNWPEATSKAKLYLVK
jgi:hypothetical protein